MKMSNLEAQGVKAHHWNKKIDYWQSVIGAYDMQVRKVEGGYRATVVVDGRHCVVDRIRPTRMGAKAIATRNVMRMLKEAEQPGAVVGTQCPVGLWDRIKAVFNA